MVQRKILMVTMSMDIGGAETHILELSKKLTSMGYEVILASAGGLYATELERYGVRHFDVPANSRSIPKMIKSFFALRRIIKAEKPDVVHAHARIPAFICSLVRKTLRFPFVTTCHGVYTAEGIVRHLTNWGEKTIAVSEDIATYLTDSYGIDRDNITVTINGIDTENFSPEIDGSEVIRELRLDPASPILLHVTRLDEFTCTAARSMINNAEWLNEIVPGVQIVIVGGGTEYDGLVEQSNLLNLRMERKTVFMTGPRSDIDRILAIADIFVGVSRACLEAMSAGKAVILAGDQGYLGPFTPDKLETAIASNFCCRGSAPIDDDTFIRDIARSLKKLTPEQRRMMGEYGRSVVLENYSLDRMTGDCIAVYEKVMYGKYNVLMSGYYGFDNLGDEAILQSICRNIKAADEDIGITILSQNPEKTEKLYGYRAVHRFSVFKIIAEMRHCNALISGGGSLLQDKTSTRSLLYYLFIIRLGKLMGKKIMLYANGIGPVDKPRNRRRVRTAVSRTDVITLRDVNSAEELRRMEVERDDMRVTADPVFTMNSAPKERGLELLRINSVPEDKPFVTVSVRNWKGIEQTGFCGKIAELCDYIHTNHSRYIVFIAMHSDDMNLGRKIRGMMENESYIIDTTCTPEELMSVMSQADFALSMRLHALIFSARVAVPTIGMVYDPKMDYYLEMLGMPSMGRVEEIDTAQVKVQIDDMIQSRDSHAQSLKTLSAQLEEAAQNNEKYLLELLESEEIY